MIVLFKPQFEVGREGLGKGGVVRDEEVLQKSVDEFKTWCEENEFQIKDIIDSPIQGKDGNREKLVWFHFND